MQVENHDNQVLTAVIVDDEPAVSQALGKLLSLYCPRVQVVAIADSVTSCVEALAQNDIDLVFLDIALGRESGFDLFTKVRQVEFQVIFTTSYSEFAIKAIRAEAVDYLLKPIDPVELRTAVDRALSGKRDHEVKNWSQPITDESGLTVPNNGIAVVTSDGINLLHLEEIVHVEGSGSYSTFYMIDGTTLVASRNLMHYERLIESRTFFRTHQSHLINLSHLKSFSANNSQVLLTGDRAVSVSKTKKPMLIERIRELYRGV